MYNIILHLKQLFPFKYDANYKDNKGREHYVTFRLFMGVSFNVKDYIIKEEYDSGGSGLFFLLKK